MADTPLAVPEAPVTAPAEEVRSRRLSRMAAYWELTKPGIAAFVMMTAGVSYFVAARGGAAPLPLFHTLLGTVLGTAGALALNQYVEREPDALMRRTRRRPLPSGRLRPVEALTFGLLLLLSGVAYLWATVGLLPAALTAASALAYILVYTPLKPRSYMATLAGAVPGALPALIGWSAATGDVTLGALTLFGIAFLWQLPHVLALGWMLREDYARAGFLLIPPADPAGRRIGAQLLLYCTALIPVSLFPTLLGLTGGLYFAGALLLGLGLLAVSAVAARDMTNVSARRVFLASLAYHPVLLFLMVVDTVGVAS